MDEKKIAQRLVKIEKEAIGTSHEKEIKQHINSALNIAEELYKEDLGLVGWARLRGVINKLNEARRIIQS